MEVKLGSIYVGQGVFKEGVPPHLESYAEVYNTAIGGAGDQPAISERRMKEKRVEVIDLEKEIELVKGKLQEFKGVEGNIDDENFTTGSRERNEDLALLKRVRGRAETEKAIGKASIAGYIALIVIAAVCPVAAAAPGLYMLFKAAVVVISSALVGSGMMLINDLENLDDLKEYFKKKGYLDKEGNAIDVSQNPVKLRLEKSLARLQMTLKAIEKE